MRIAFISTPFLAVPPRLYGGTELVVHELCEGLVAAGHDVVLFATGDSRTNAELRSLYLETQWPPEMLSDLNHVSWAMQQVADDGRFDLIHAHSAVALACGRLLPTVPLVYTIHHERDERLSAFYRHCQEVNYVAISNDQRRREIPLDHVEALADADASHEGLLGHLMLVAARIARESGLADKGFRVVMNSGVGAGQTVFHVHLHVLAGRSFGWPPG